MAKRKGQKAKTTSPALLDVEKAKALVRELDLPPKVDRVTHMQAGLAEGARAGDLVKKIWKTTKGPGGLSADEFFYYQLYSPKISLEEAHRFIGKKRQHEFHSACNDPRWFALSNDKGVFYQFFEGAGLPLPRTKAVFSPSGRNFYQNTLKNQKALEKFLSAKGNYPLFIKPVDGIFSVGAFYLKGLKGNKAIFFDGTEALLGELVNFMAHFSSEGYLLQAPLKPNPKLKKAFGETLPSVRFLTFYSKEPEIISAVIKIPSAANEADNFWREGNMLGSLDLKSGKIKRIVCGVGKDQKLIKTHPQTGAKLINFLIPDWKKAMSLCHEAAGFFPKVRTQSWDIALTEKGPVLLEFNFGGDLNLHQLAHNRGLLTEKYIAHLKACGFKKI